MSQPFTDAEKNHAADQALRIVAAIRCLHDAGYTIEAAVRKIAIEAEIPYSTIRGAIGMTLAGREVAV